MAHNDDELFKNVMAGLGVRPMDGGKKLPLKQGSSLPETGLNDVASEQMHFLDAEPLGVDSEDFEEGSSHRRKLSGGGVSSEDRRLFLEAMRHLDTSVAVDRDGFSEPEPEPGLRRLKRAKSQGPAPQETLDLHGMVRKDALAALRKFITQSFVKSRRAVLVITGKGLRSQDGVPVLKPAVEQWILREGKRFVRAYGEARPDQGGRGAFVVYLRDK